MQSHGADNRSTFLCHQDVLCSRSARYRVIGRCRNGVRILVALAHTRDEAIEIAKSLADAIRQRRRLESRRRTIASHRVVVIQVEQWRRTWAGMSWCYCGVKFGGFNQVDSELVNPKQGAARKEDSRKTDAKPTKQSKSQPKDDSTRPPVSGDKVECELLAKKTRKGGWLARVRQQGLSGPITNADAVPVSMKAGAIVVLRIGAINRARTRIQFDWLPDSEGQSTETQSQRVN